MEYQNKMWNTEDLKKKTKRKYVGLTQNELN